MFKNLRTGNAKRYKITRTYVHVAYLYADSQTDAENQASHSGTNEYFDEVSCVDIVEVAK